MNIYETLPISERLHGNTYPGRGIVLGLSADGERAVAAYFIMGRSANSRNRIFTVKNGDQVDVKATVTNLVKRSGFYLLKPAHGGAVKRIAVTK